MPATEVFAEFALILAMAALMGALGLLLRQPLIVAFIAVGIVLGPAGLGWVTAADEIDLLAKLGITLLLFVVGLRLDLHLIRTVGPVALATGLGQVFFTSVFGYLIAVGFGFSPIASLYVAVALTFSSTIIIVKLLSDKREIDSLHGRIAVGFLIVQDIVVVLAMIGLAALGTEAGDGPLWRPVALVLVKGLGFLLVIGLLMRFVLDRVVVRLARLPELLVLAAIAWAALLAAVAEGLGLSKEVGAFLGGVSLASTEVREMIAARLVSLRDFLLLFFFIDLGAQLDLGAVGAELPAAVAFSVFVLVGNPLIVMVIMRFMGYGSRTGFLAGLTVAQVSEFSLILVAMGMAVGHVGAEVVGLTTLVALITISGSTYMILYSRQLYDWLRPYLAIFEPGSASREAQLSPLGPPGSCDVLLFGAGPFGRAIGTALRQFGRKVVAVDFDPEAVKAARREGFIIYFGDAGHPEFIGNLPVSDASWVVSTIQDSHTNQVLLSSLREGGYGGRTAVRAPPHGDADALRSQGVDLVLLPYEDAAREAALRVAGIEPAREQLASGEAGEVSGASPARSE